MKKRKKKKEIGRDSTFYFLFFSLGKKGGDSRRLFLGQGDAFGNRRRTIIFLSFLLFFD